MPSLCSLLTTSTALIALIPTLTTALFTLNASLPGSALDNQPINAAGEAFWVGGEAATYCPTEVDPYCPNVTGTIFAGMDTLFVEVPGGQQTYVTTEGAFGFTEAHSDSIPVGAYQYGWTDTNVTSDCDESYILINFLLPGATTGGIFACPVTTAGTTSYQIYAQTPAFNQTNCIELDGLVEQVQATNDFGAWQYV